MLTIFVDGDSCPVKDEILKVTDRHRLELYIVSNTGGWRPGIREWIHNIMVEKTPDAADDWIINHINHDDIVITADILLAQRCLQHQAYALNPNGQLFTENNIGNVVAMRNLKAHLREIGEIGHGQSSFSKQHRSKFLQSFEEIIQEIKRK